MAKSAQGRTKEPTPMMRQYLEVKERYPGYLLLFRVGDFYETFLDDAVTVSSALNIVLTRRSNGGAGEIPLAGFPHHASEGYIAKLVTKGFKVAVCDQVEDPALAKGIVKREITDIVTPGITYSDKILDDRHNNYLCAVAPVKRGREHMAGVAFVDVTTAEFRMTELPLGELKDFLQSLRPSEILISSRDKELRESLAKSLFSGALFTTLDEWMFTEEQAARVLENHFKTHSLKGFGIEGYEAGRIAAGVILQYLEEAKQGSLKYLVRIGLVESGETMTLDIQTCRNLEIISSMQDGSLNGSLLEVIDRTKNPMGARLLRRWLLHPLRKLEPVVRRHDAVGELLDAPEMREGIRGMLGGIIDLERALARIATSRAMPREVRQLGSSLAMIPQLKSLLEGSKSLRLRELALRLDPLPELAETIEKALDAEASGTLRDGGYIRAGYHAELDELRAISSGARDRLLEIQQQERQRTSISTLKVQYNKVFGYYIEVSRANSDKVPEYYEKKQTLVNAERYTIPALKEYEEKILTAEEKSQLLEHQLFQELCAMIAEQAASIQTTAAALAELDCLACFASCADEFGYCRPVMNEGTELSIRAGRHPVLERILGADEPYVANDCQVGSEQQLLIITGPNMAGKSSYLRQVGLVVLLAQVGCFVPAESAEIGLVDRIFTRVGASDNLTSGESTFLVEMNEAASILNNATERSLLLLDEIGRGTSTFDGMSIAWSMCEYIHDQLRSRTLFATHYHELAELESRFERIVNFNATVVETADTVIFLRKIVRGASDNSYGIEVAKMAGMPPEVIERAREILAGMERREVEVPVQRQALPLRVESRQISLFEEEESRLRKALSGIDINRLTPLDALMELKRLQEIALGKGA
ncbi:MAG TPA: DNA mismatch repair protein MutS [Chlorobaculum sp.]|uniref:DNA mismatch repair protein MutS n=1 Tax=Chlorobaculum tepidum (strain ATCC 49652 / DSM 12025 / NBRC 103806 / TLS) TaxID=194439 RepID=MUTS_CHLTE|nr:DNA mismatch repair protein MutS [Chlorobaculum tepidum]Q8KCC0.1 RecName: Full=DNA mismatch repair protein MutS [Chlorobaculum tepidum TLS]AAM72730.1 DNA mismatch repair protein MutS [Chlorobaculum tepidum TLS]HBU22607.1 DNA mismatch repair protein MutS [Chlorobaculum sp.]